MIVKTLYDFSVRNQLPPGYGPVRIAHVLTLNAKGEVIGQDDPKKEIVTGPVLSRSRGQNITSGFFVDDPDYALSVDKSETSARFTTVRHATFVELVRQVAEETDDAGARAVHLLLSNEKKMHALQADGPWEGKVAFKFDGGYVFDRPVLKKCWENRVAAEANEGRTGMCAVTGEVAQIARLHPSIKGLPGSKGSGLISFNMPVVEFDGRAQGDNFPCSNAVATGYALALNHMLGRREDGRMRHALDLGKGNVLLFWTSDERSIEPLLTVMNPLWPDVPKKDAEGKKLTPKQRYDQAASIYAEAVNAAWEDLKTWPAKEVTCYALVLRANMTRIMVLDSFELPVGTFVERLLQFRKDFGGGAVNMKDTLRSLDMFEKPTILALPIVRAILNGRPYPVTMIHRLRVLPDIWWTAINSRCNKETSMSFDPNHKNPAYHMGAVAAAAEFVKKALVGKSGNLTMDIQSAAVTPVRGLPRIFAQTNRNLNKSCPPKMRPTFNVGKELYTEACGKISEIPKRHMDPDIAAFYTGYNQAREELGQRLEARLVESRSAREVQTAAE